MSVSAKADFREVKELAGAARRAVPLVLRAAVARAVALTRAEFPYERFRKGIKPELEPNRTPAEGRVVADLPVRRDPVPGTLHLPGGATRSVELRGSKPFNVLEAVQTGTGLYGPKGRVIKPRAAGALLVGVDSVSPGESFITAPGGPFVIRRQSEGMRPNDYPARAAVRLEGELDLLVDKELEAAGL
jgi:hypothetical protein